LISFCPLFSRAFVPSFLFTAFLLGLSSFFFLKARVLIVFRRFSEIHLDFNGYFPFTSYQIRLLRSSNPPKGPLLMLDPRRFSPPRLSPPGFYTSSPPSSVKVSPLVSNVSATFLDDFGFPRPPSFRARFISRTVFSDPLIHCGGFSDRLVSPRHQPFPSPSS